MKRKVYNPRPEYILTGRPNIDIWNQEYVINPFIDAESVYDSEEWKIMLKFEILNKKLRVLEAGCGNGKLIKALYGLVEYICGIYFAITGLKAIKEVIKNNFKIKHYELFWLDLGLRDDFRGLYPFVKYPIEFFSRIAQFKKSVNFAFMLFICQKI